jgi:hypothetical protein
MIEQIFGSPLRVQASRDSPSGALLEGFAQELSQWGYAERTARRYIRAAEHFIYWANTEGIPAAGFSSQFVPRFDEHLRRCRCPGYG